MLTLKWIVLLTSIKKDVCFIQFFLLLFHWWLWGLGPTEYHTLVIIITPQNTGRQEMLTLYTPAVFVFFDILKVASAMILAWSFHTSFLIFLIFAVYKNKLYIHTLKSTVKFYFIFFFKISLWMLPSHWHRHSIIAKTKLDGL